MITDHWSDLGPVKTDLTNFLAISDNYLETILFCQKNAPPPPVSLILHCVLDSDDR